MAAGRGQSWDWSPGRSECNSNTLGHLGERPALAFCHQIRGFLCPCPLTPTHFTWGKLCGQRRAPPSPLPGARRLLSPHLPSLLLSQVCVTCTVALTCPQQTMGGLFAPARRPIRQCWAFPSPAGSGRSPLAGCVGGLIINGHPWPQVQVGIWELCPGAINSDTLFCVKSLLAAG